MFGRTKRNERADFPFLFLFFFVQTKKMAQKGGGLLAHMSKRLGQVNVGALIGESVRNYWAAPVVSTLAYLPYEWYHALTSDDGPSHHFLPRKWAAPDACAMAGHATQVPAGGDGPIGAGAALPTPHGPRRSRQVHPPCRQPQPWLPRRLRAC